MIANAPTSRHRPSQPPPRVTDAVGPFKGMRSSLAAPDKQYAEWLHNCYSANPYEGGEIVARPGRVQYPKATQDGLVQLGALDGTVRSNQLFTDFVSSSTSIRRLVSITGGKFYATFNPSAPTTTGWFEAVNAATFTAAGITLNTSQPYYAVAFNGKLIVCTFDLAFQWDGTTNGGVTKLTNAGTSFFGRPVVHAAKVFFIRGNRKTIVWCEENDATTGYELGGFSNAWDLTETSFDLLTALIASNAGLFYFRTSGIGVIEGGSNADFRTSSTLDSVSATEGTDYPEAAILVGDTVWFLNNQGRPCYFHIASRDVEPAWLDIERAFTPYISDGRGYEFLAGPNSEQTAFITYGSAGQAVHVRSLDMVFFSYRYFFSTAGAGAFDVLIGFHAGTKAAQTAWTFPTPIARITEHYDQYVGTGAFALGMIDQYGNSYSVIPSYLGSYSANTLYWFTDRNTQTGVDVDMVASIVGPRHFEAKGVELRAKRLDLEYIGQINGAPLELRIATPYTMREGGVRFDTTLPIVLILEGNASSLTDAQNNAPLNAELSVGLNELGRWVAFGISWANRKSLARIKGWSVSAQPDNQGASIP